MKRALLTFLLTSLFLLPLLARAEVAPLPADEAFRVNLYFDQNTPANLVLQWDMAPGYYIYRDSIQARIKGEPIKLSLPPAVYKKDVEKRKEAIYANQFSLALPNVKLVNVVPIIVQYQGCSQSGFCYPPMTKQFKVNAVNQTIMSIDVKSRPSFLNAFLTDQNQTREALSSKGFIVSLFIFLGLGVLLAFTPCVLPMVPILVSIIAGHKQRSTHVTNQHVFSLCLAYVLGVAMTYALVGVIAAMLGSSIQVWLQKPFFILLGSLIFILLGLSLFGLFELYVFKGMQNAIANWTRHLKGGSHLGVFTMGVLSVLLISPCTTAPLIGVLLYISQTGNLLFGASTLFVMGMGMGVPLLMVGMSADKWLPRRGPWMEWVKKFFGVLMIGMAVWMAARAGMFNFIKPTVITASQQQFIHVQDLQEFNKQLAASVQSRRPIILDFYADWCESCVSMEEKVFSNRSVANTLTPFTMLRIDLTANTPTDEMLMKYFNVIAPPTVLFFDEQGKEVSSKRIVGEVNAEEFVQRIDTFIDAGCSKSATC